MFDALDLARPHLRELSPYTSARDDFSGTAHVFLDANENPFGSVAGGLLNRYPDPHQRELKSALGDLLSVDPGQIFVGNGSDEAIDLLTHAFCEPGDDHIVTTPPTYGMYSVTAAVNNVAVREVVLREDYSLDARAVIHALTPRSKLVFLCSPNNPTGNLHDKEAMVDIIAAAPGLVVVDEAYVDFAPGGSMLAELAARPNLVILRTFSKAWGMAAARVGVSLSHPTVARLLERIKLPYNLSQLAQQSALDAISNVDARDRFVARIVEERGWLSERLSLVRGVEHVHRSDANFLLARFTDAPLTYRLLVEAGVIVRDRSNVILCEGALRITVGTREENQALIAALEGIADSP